VRLFSSSKIFHSQIHVALKMVGFDSDDKLVKLLTVGAIAALVLQDPFRMGYNGVKPLSPDVACTTI
jgi:ribose transport system substrate-binding protein